MGSEKVKAENYNLNFGTNIIHNCNGTVIYKTKKGKEEELFILEKSAGKLLLTTKIRNEKGELLGKLNRNSFVYVKDGFDVESHYELQIIQNMFMLIRKDDGKEIFKAEIIDDMNIQVTGVFYAGSTKIEATDEKLMIGTNTLIGCAIKGFTSAMLIKEGGFAIGVSRR